jgi:uncharacterized protein YjbI with pentapeptide repeats
VNRFTTVSRYAGERAKKSKTRANFLIVALFLVGGGMLWLAFHNAAMSEGSDTKKFRNETLRDVGVAFVVGGVIGLVFTAVERSSSYENEVGQLRPSMLSQLAATTDLERVDLADMDLTGALLRNKHLSGSFFMRSNLTKADFWRSDLSRSNLTATCLQFAFLAETNLSNCLLRGADLFGADLNGADLRGADLREAILRGADLRDVIVDAQTKIDGIETNGAQLSPGSIFG